MATRRLLISLSDDSVRKIPNLPADVTVIRRGIDGDKVFIDVASPSYTTTAPIPDVDLAALEPAGQRHDTVDVLNAKIADLTAKLAAATAPKADPAPDAAAPASEPAQA